jgi:hypothetical protein
VRERILRGANKAPYAPVSRCDPRAVRACLPDVLRRTRELDGTPDSDERATPVCYPALMIKDREAYARLCENEQWDALRAMTIDASIAVLEALLTSELMDIAVFPDDDHPMSLARSLGIPAARLHRVT